MGSNLLALYLFLRLVCVSGEQNEDMNMMATYKLTISSQGKNLCPDSSDSSSSRIIRARSQLDCARKCKENPDCLYHSYHKDNGTCQHGLKGALPTSLISSSDCQLMVDADAFKGCSPKVKPSGTCDMPFQFNKVEFLQCAAINGSKCMNSSGKLIDCIAPVGFTVAQETVNIALNQTSVPLPCISNWIVLMYRYNGAVNFTRKWADYKKGFGDLLTSEFWIGNNNIHLITSQPTVAYRLRIEFQALNSSNWYYAEYTTFVVDSESNGYTIHLSGFQGNAGDSLTNTTLPSKWNHNRMKFTTPDVDNDRWTGDSCAAWTPSGWWFNYCYYACLTCKYSSGDFVWSTMVDLQIEVKKNLRAARMMVMVIA